MQNQTETGWIDLVSFTAASLDGVGDADGVHGESKLLKYIRWEVTSLGGASAIVFDLAGMLRRRE